MRYVTRSLRRKFGPIPLGFFKINTTINKDEVIEIFKDDTNEVESFLTCKRRQMDRKFTGIIYNYGFQLLPNYIQYRTSFFPIAVGKVFDNSIFGSIVQIRLGLHPFTLAIMMALLVAGVLILLTADWFGGTVFIGIICVFEYLFWKEAGRFKKSCRYFWIDKK